MVDLDLRPVELDDQERLHVERIAGMDEVLGGADRRPVHHLHAAGNDAAADDVGDALPGLLAGRETDEQGARTLRFPEDAHGDLGDHRKQPLRSGEHAEQVVALRVEMASAEPYDLAVDQHHLDAEYIVRGQAVFQAVDAAGIFRDVAADRAGDLRGWIGRVVETLALDGLRDAEIGDAGLGDHGAIGKVDLQDAVEAAHHQQHGVLEGQRAARKRRPGPARHDPYVVPAAIFHDARDLLDGLRQHDHHRQLPVGGQPVGFEGAHLVDRVDDALAGHDRPQVRDDAGAPGKRLLARFRHCGTGHRELRVAGKKLLPVAWRQRKRSNRTCSFRDPTGQTN